MADSAGQRLIGPYALLSRLGHGGNADVWLAQLDGGEPVAVKVLRAKPGSEPWRRFAREVEVVKGLAAEPGVLPILASDLDERSRDAWYAMPVAETAEIALAGAALAQVVEAAAGFSETLARLAQRGIHHRDVKPSNLYRFGDRWTVGDFGLVAIPDAEPITGPNRALGPRNYLPYELIVSPDTAPGGPVDVYELAKTLWVLATPLPSAPFGHQPADGSEYTLERMLSDPLRTEIDRLIDRATRTDPLQRPSMGGFHDELRAWLEAAARTAGGAPGSLGEAALELREAFGGDLSTAQLRERAVVTGRERITELSARMATLEQALAREVPGAVRREPYSQLLLSVLADPRVDAIPDPVFTAQDVIVVAPRTGIADPQLLLGVIGELREDGNLVIRAAVYFDRPGIDWAEGNRVFECVAPADSIQTGNGIAGAVAALTERAPDALRRLRELLS